MATNEPPQVQLIHPTDGLIYGWPSVKRLEAEATDSDGEIVRVEFLESATNLLGTVTSEPYRLWVTNGFGHGRSLTFSARAFDNAGASSTSEPVTVFVSLDQTPTPVITSPRDGDVFEAGEEISYEVTLQFADDSGHNSVEFFVDGESVALDTNFPYRTTLQGLAIGQHTLRARATNQLGNPGWGREITIWVLRVELRNPELQSDADFGFCIEGLLPGITNIVQGSSDFLNWESVLTNVAETTSVKVVDTSAPLFDRRHYRVLVPRQ